MVTIPGASGFVNTSTLANTRGLAAQSPTLLNSGSTISLLDAGRGNAAGQFGLSSSARALNQSFINRTADVNALFSLGAGGDATIEGAQQQILALRGGLPDSQVSRSIVEDRTPVVTEDDGGVAASETGQVVDEAV